MVGLKGKMPCVSGLLVAKELDAFSKVLDPELKKTPLTSIVGGAKISDKVLVINNLIDKSDNIIICGGKCNFSFRIIYLILISFYFHCY